MSHCPKLNRNTRRRAFFFIAIATLFVALSAAVVFRAFASDKIWDFTNSADYNIDSQVQIVSGKAELKPQDRWFNVSWVYRQEIQLSNSGSELTNYPVKLTLSNTNFEFANTNTNGEDIRATDYEGTTSLPYYLESYNKAGETGILWVNVPLLPASTSTSIYIYYGNSSATSLSSADSVYERYEDYNTNNDTTYHRTIGHDGTWFTYNSDPQWYGSPSPTFFTSNRPQAIYYSGTYNRTYLSYGSDGNPMGINIKYYDHDTDTISSTVKIDDNPCGVDAHANPSLAIDTSGYIYAFYGSETCALKVKKSTNPEDISAWGTAVDISATDEEYAQPLFIGNTLYVFYRHRVSDSPYLKTFGYKKSTDFGATWSTYNEVINFSAPANIYGIVKVGKESPIPSIHISWSRLYYVSVNDNEMLDAYYTVSYDGGTTWEKSDGTDLSLPMTELTSDKFYDSGTKVDWPLDIQLDSNNRPYILNIVGDRTSPSDNRGTYSFLIHKFNGSSWSTYTVATGADHYFDRGSIYVETDSTIRAYLTLDGRAQEDGGEIREYTSTDSGATWSKTKELTNSGNVEHNYPKTVENATNDFIVYWGYGNSAPTYLLGYGDSFQSDSFTFSAAGQEIFSYLGGTVERANNRAEITTNDTSYTQEIVFSDPVPNNVRYQKIKFTPASTGTNYRFMPLQFLWQKTGLEDGSRWAIALFWYSSGLYLRYTPSNGAALSSVLLTSATPTAGTTYTVELYQIGTVTTARVVRDSDSAVIYSGNTTTYDYSSAALYPAAGQYAGSTPGTIIGYFDDWIVRQYTSSEPTPTYNTEATIYSSADPTIKPINANSQTYTSLNSFTESATKNSGEIKYQLSNDGGTSWLWYDGGGWSTTTAGYTEANTATVVDSNIATLPIGSGELLFRSYLHSDGITQVQLDSITADYSYDNQAPAITLNPMTPNPTSDVRPTITGTSTDELGTVSSVVFQIDSFVGDWNACTSTDSAFEEPSEQFECTPTEDLAEGEHIVYVSSTDNLGNTTSGDEIKSITFTIDTTEPLNPTVLIDNGANASSSAVQTISLSAENADEMIISEDPLFDGADWQAYATTTEYTFTETTGVKTLYVRFRDSLENTTDIVSDTILLDFTSPTQAIINQPVDESLTNESNPTFIWITSDDSHSGMASYSILLNGQVYVANIPSDDPGGDHTIETANYLIFYDNGTIEYTNKQSSGDLESGEYVFVVRSFDQVDNYRDSDSITFTVDSDNPFLRLNSIDTETGLNILPSSQANQVVIVSNLRPVISGSAEATSTLTLTSTDFSCNFTVASNGLWSCQPPEDLEYASYTLNISAEDEAGNISQLPNIIMLIAEEETESEQTEHHYYVYTNSTDESSSSSTTTENTTPTSTPENPDNGGLYKSVEILVLDSQNKPLVGATVTMYPGMETVVTDENGTAIFTNIAPGSYTITITYNGFTTQQEINLKAGNTAFTISIIMPEVNKNTNTNFVSILAIVAGVIVAGFLLYTRSKRN